MKELLAKLSSYSIFNYLFPGVLFAVIGDRLTSITLLVDDIILGIFVYYFFGLVISRIGSLLIEPLLKKTRILQFAPYADFVQASKIDVQIELLSETNNMYRTLISVFVCLILLYAFELIRAEWPDYLEFYFAIGVDLLVALFIFSYRKQTKIYSSADNTDNSKERHQRTR